MRHILVHYHIFKNAGSSLDAILKKSFTSAWAGWDPGEPHSVFSARELTEFILSRPDVAALSSHVARPPVPDIQRTTVYPLFFVRHPLLRVASVYKYERKLKGETEAQRMAMSSTFAEYVKWRLRPDVEGVVRDFQTVYLSGEQLRYDDPRRAKATSSAFTRAVALLDDTGVFGIVERFNDSMEIFEAHLGHVFPQIQWAETRVNVTGESLGTLDEIREELGPSLYAELEAHNMYDLALYDMANSQFAAVKTALAQRDSAAAVAVSGWGR